MLRSLIFTLVLSSFLMSLSSCAQTPTSSALAANEGWLTSLEEAYKISKKTGRPILANFTGSDWCGWCKRLTANVFVTDEFKKWANKNVILLELDYPRYKKLPDDLRQQNASLQQQFQIQGFPTVWVFDLEKDKTTKQFQIAQIGRTGYKPTSAEFITDVNNILANRKK
ncbi:MAG: thioredoxin family protein [Saprospiraceae bacterium]|jgi:thioredoxin-related protein|nr:thioredoxin family protein [Saprospiraceae bacterium]MBK7795696.1 thioredoxin family protein [Saprospiraceae bacterium]MBK8154214.1 thioredoxin family protein [Saprospiraceae bacterium]MBL0260806.1 thioredoxin family protein [Saprospiraceae bacterium]MBX7164288.1 thioredoxin family protein [Saprospiraceae bacterium]